MITTIKNQHICISVNSLGAEISSLQTVNDDEYLWQGDPAIWKGQAPNLFPFIGKINNGRYQFEGKKYSISKHGFAKTSEFKLINQSDINLTYRLSDSPETLECYPFKFDLDISFTLDGKELIVTYKVANNSSTIMPFSLGAHPAFALNWTQGDSITDYYIEFDEIETCPYQQFNGKGLGRIKHPSLVNTSILNITKSMFEIDATIYQGLKSEAVTLRSNTSEKSVRVQFPGFTYLGLWSKPGAAYVCIEPWYGTDDYEDFNGELIKKDGVEIIDVGKYFSGQYSILIG
jgi:galactose mutarotase-like enzyme